MSKIKNIIFDFGGVIITLDPAEAVRRFAALGLPNAESQLDAYTQGGIFGALEEGKITAEEFRQQFGALCGKEFTWEECQWAWLGYRKELPVRNIEILKLLRKKGYRLILLSNTNPYMSAWFMSSEFSKGLDAECPEGKPVSHYFDSAYLSYELGVMKPNDAFFTTVLAKENILPSETLFVDDGPRNVAAASQLGISTFMPVNGEDWNSKLLSILED